MRRTFNLSLILISILVTIACSNDDSNAEVDADFQLPSTNFVSAKMEMHLVYPRPDSETQSHSRHRLMHSQMSYKIPIGIQGGAWPFKYEIISAPTGASIGQLYGSDNYGVLIVSAIASGTHNFAIKVTDQELNTVDVNWTATVDDSKFTFIQDGYTGTKEGTIEQPLEDVTDWYKDDKNDTSYANQIIVFRDGNYTLVGPTSENGNIEINSGTKTPSLISFPDETPVIDCSSTKIFSRGGINTQDMFVAGIRWENSRQDVNNAHFFWATGDVTRSTWWNNYFYNHDDGIVGNDNSCAVFVSNTSIHKYNILYKQNIHDTFNNNAGNGSYVDMYYSSYVLIEENIAKNSNVNYGFWAKGTTSFVTLRANEAYDNVAGSQMTFGYGIECQELPHDNEMCWNRIRLDFGSNGNISWAGSNAYEGETYNSYIYRNTFVNGYPRIRFKGNENYETEGNLIISSHSDISKHWDSSIMDETLNILGGESDGYTDQTGKLLDTTRDEYLGKVGFEVSNNN